MWPSRTRPQPSLPCLLGVYVKELLLHYRNIVEEGRGGPVNDVSGKLNVNLGGLSNPEVTGADVAAKGRGPVQVAGNGGGGLVGQG